MEKAQVLIKEGLKVELLGHFGTDRDIANAAWTSSLDLQKKEKRTDEDVAKVVRFLINNRHASPIEQVVYRFYLSMPIFVSRQFMRHRIQSPNEMSGRYRIMPAEFYEIPKDVEKIAEKVGDTALVKEWDELNKKAYETYQKRLEKYWKAEEAGKITNDEYKRFREIMRGILGTAYYTKITTAFNLRSLANFFKLRLDPHAQPEIQEIARQMLEAIESAGNCPVAIETLKKNNWQI
ncbi:FAD-dependent thymidylate synthase [Candidatus Margulisiibacteriota bacterium]